jgi:hypothetical protein
MLAAAANVAIVIVAVTAVNVAIVIIPIAVIALVFVLRRLLVLSSRPLVVACCFASVVDIFAMCPSFG